MTTVTKETVNSEIERIAFMLQNNDCQHWPSIEEFIDLYGKRESYDSFDLADYLNSF